MSRTKRKGIWVRALKRGKYWMPGNPEFDKRHPNVSKKAFEEGYIKYVGYKCDCSWCLAIKQKKAILDIMDKEIKDFKDEVE
jgi:hypothetical protein